MRNDYQKNLSSETVEFHLFVDDHFFLVKKFTNNVSKCERMNVGLKTEMKAGRLKSGK